MKWEHGYGFTTLSYDINNSVPSLVMGDGSVGIFPVHDPEDFVAGVCFTHRSPKIVGSEALVEEDHYTSVKFQILTDNPKSLDVLIGKLQEAKEFLIKQQAGE